MKRIGIGVAVLAAVALITIAWRYWSSRPDPQVMRVQELQRQLFETRRESPTRPDALLATRFGELRDEMAKLSEAQREQLRRNMRDQFRQRMTEQIRKFHELSGKERIAFLDEQIDRMEQRRRRSRNNNVRQGRPRATASRNQSTAGSGSDAVAGGNSNSGRFRRDRRPMTDERRDARRRARLDNTTPKERAQFAAYFEALRARRKERGLPDFPRFGMRRD